MSLEVEFWDVMCNVAVGYQSFGGYISTGNPLFLQSFCQKLLIFWMPVHIHLQGRDLIKEYLYYNKIF